MEVEFFDAVYFFVSENYLGAKNSFLRLLEKTLWYFLYYWRPSWIFCVIVGQVLEPEIPQNKNVILNSKVKFVCPMCTQT